MRAPAGSSSRRWLERLAWLGALWIASVTALGIVALLLRWLMRLAGLAA